MSRKKVVIPENNLFVNNINTLVNDNGGKTAFSEKINVNYDTVRSWCMGEFMPGGAQLILIQEKFGVSIDWLLTGKVPGAESHPCAGMEDHCVKMKKIITAEHPVITPAFLANLAAFEYSIEKEKEQDEKIENYAHDVKRMKKRIRDVEASLIKGLSTGIDKAASSSTGKRET